MTIAHPLPPAASAVQIAARNNRHIPGGTASGARWVATPLVIDSASGAELRDVDGRTFIDFNSAFGAVLLGHRDPWHMARTAELCGALDMAGIGTTRLEGELAERVCDLVPCAEMVGMCCAGSEATYHAIRLARAATGRRLVVKFQGAYHGWHDYVAFNYLSTAEGLGRYDPISAGILPEAAAATLVLPFNDIDALDRALAAHAPDIAAIILEPVMHNVGAIMAEPDFLAHLRKATSRHGIVLIFDEIITGFRHALGGYQSICGVTPDLATFGKALGSGQPISLVTGTRDLMRHFAPRSMGGDVLLGGTFNGHPMAVAAALATIERMARPDAYPRLYALGQRLRDGLVRAAEAAGVPMQVTHYGSIVCPLFMEGPVRRYEDLIGFDAARDLDLRHGLLARGFACTATPHRRFAVSLAHTEAHIDAFCAAAADILARPPPGA